MEKARAIGELRGVDFPRHVTEAYTPCKSFFFQNIVVLKGTQGRLVPRTSSVVDK
jgi:hypothetical protein